MLPEYFNQTYWRQQISEAVETPDPALSNRMITLVHYRLSQVLQSVTGPDSGANFHTWAVWGSRKAGVTISTRRLGRSTAKRDRRRRARRLVGRRARLGDLNTFLANRVAVDRRSSLRIGWNVLWRVNGSMDSHI